MTSSSSSIHSMNDYGRYKITRQSPQVADVQSTLKPARTIDEIAIIHSGNVVKQTSKDTGSKSEAEIWSLTGPLMKYLDYCRRSYVLSLRRNTLLLNHCQELSI